MPHISGFVRQNPWGKLDHSLGSVKSSGVLHCPWGHTYQDTYDLKQGPFDKKYAKHFVNTFCVGDILVVAEADTPEVLLVQITSEPLVGTLDHLCLVRRTRQCTHTLTHPDCVQCKDSIVAVYHTPDVKKEDLLQHLMEGHIAEPFHSIYRKVDILKSIDIREEKESFHDYCKYIGSIKTTPYIIEMEARTE